MKGKLRKPDFENLRDIVWISEPVLSPDGETFAYTRGVSDYASGKILSQIVEKSVNGNHLPEKAWDGRLERRSPLYSPDGKYLAFLASDGRPWQLWLKDRESGEFAQLTHVRHGVDHAVWSPDGKALAFEAGYDPGEGPLSGEFTAEEYRDYRLSLKKEPKVIEKLIYKKDSTHGWVGNGSTGIVLCCPADGDVHLITPQDHRYLRPHFTDEGTICCYGYPHEHAKESSSELYLIDAHRYLQGGGAAEGENRKEKARGAEAGEAEGGTDVSIRMLEKTVPSYYSFRVQADAEGKLIYCGVTMEDGSPIPELWSVSPQGGGSRQLFATKLCCHGLSPILSGDTHRDMEDPEFTILPDGTVLFCSCHMGRSNIFAWNGEKVYPLTDDDCVLTFSGPSGGKLLLQKSDWNRPSYLTLAALRKDADGLYHVSGEKVLADENAWTEEYAWIKPEKMSVRSLDGKADIYGWVVIPEDPEAEGAKAEEQEAEEAQSEPQKAEKTQSELLSAEKRGKIAAVLDVHGGPESCYVRGFFYEAQMMAARGMAVLYCDPRGASGYGGEFLQDRYAYGKEAVEDYQAFIRAACRKYPQIDEHRIGVTGGSYGGHMTMKLISLTDDFAAAVTQRTWVNPASSYGTGEIGFYSSGAPEATFQEYMENRVHRSIIRYIRNVKVPVLILHGEDDYTCGLEQGVQVYNAMVSLHPGLPCRIVIFPGENHGVTRHGLMHNQIRHMKEMTDWFVKYLAQMPQKESQNTAKRTAKGTAEERDGGETA